MRRAHGPFQIHVKVSKIFSKKTYGGEKETLVPPISSMEGAVFEKSSNGRQVCRSKVTLPAVLQSAIIFLSTGLFLLLLFPGINVSSALFTLALLPSVPPQSLAFRTAPVKCWWRRPGTLLPARILRMVSLKLNKDAIVKAFRTIWPPPSFWLPSITKTFCLCSSLDASSGTLLQTLESVLFDTLACRRFRREFVRWGSGCVSLLLVKEDICSRNTPVRRYINGFRLNPQPAGNKDTPFFALILFII